MPFQTGARRDERGAEQTHENAHQLIVHNGAPGLFVLLMLGITGLPIADEPLLSAARFLIRQAPHSPS